jgi:hypothetical protein
VRTVDFDPVSIRLRDPAGETFAAIAARLGRSGGTPQKLYRPHRECIDDATYGDAYAALLSKALRSLHGG